MCNDIFSLFLYHTEYLHRPKNSVCSPCLPFPPLTETLTTFDLFTASIALPFQEGHTADSLFRLASFTSQYAFTVPPCLFVAGQLISL